MQAVGCVQTESLEPFTRQAVDEMVPSGMEAVEARRFGQGARKTGLERF